MTIENNNLNKLKEQYLKELNLIDIKVQKILESNSQETGDKLIKIVYDTYTIWNDELNKIYAELKNIIPSNEIDKVKEKEIQWISYKNKMAKNDEKIYWGCAGSSVFAINLIKLTKNRCYYLVNIYM